MREFFMLEQMPKPGAAEDVDYEPFPAQGEPVFTTHPAFVYDKELSGALDGAYLYLLVAVKTRKDRPGFDEYKAWLGGQIPIPEEWWDALLEMRGEWLVDRGLPTDLPVGWEKLEQMRAAEQAKESA